MRSGFNVSFQGHLIPLPPTEQVMQCPGRSLLTPFQLMIPSKPGNTVRPNFKQHSLYWKIIQKDPAFYQVCVSKGDLRVSHESLHQVHSSIQGSKDTRAGGQGGELWNPAFWTRDGWHWVTGSRCGCLPKTKSLKILMGRKVLSRCSLAGRTTGGS